MKGNMQLFSVDQQRSQALESHAASFAQFKVRNSSYTDLLSYFSLLCNFQLGWSKKSLLVMSEQVPGNDNPSTLISFATKSINAGQITSKLHVIELGAQPGCGFSVALICSTEFVFFSNSIRDFLVWLCKKNVKYQFCITNSSYYVVSKRIIFVDLYCVEKFLVHSPDCLLNIFVSRKTIF